MWLESWLSCGDGVPRRGPLPVIYHSARRGDPDRGYLIKRRIQKRGNHFIIPATPKRRRCQYIQRRGAGD